MDEVLIDIIKTNKIFSSLDRETIAKILPKFTKIQLNPYEVLFYQGDASDSIYLLVAGKLAASLTAPTGETKMVDHIDSGDTVGESGALTNEPRALTVRAIGECMLYRMLSKDFIEICHQYPSVMFATIHPMVERSNSLLHLLTIEKTKKHIVIIPASNDTSLEKFAEKLQKHAENYPSIILLSDYHPEFENHTDDTIKERIIAVEKTRKKSHKILYLLKSHVTPLAKASLKRAHVIYITAYSNSTPKIDSYLLGKINHNKSTLNLVLLHTESTIMPRNTASWLSLAPFIMNHHLRINLTKDYLRLLRYVRGKAVGLVLSGGGTRGWAHLGAIKALREEKFPIDMIGGTSVGAIIAGCYALHQSYDDAYERFAKVVQDSAHSVAWRSLTWPVISLFNAKKFTQSLIDIFNGIAIEDLWLPFFCVTCNLATSSEETHTSGLLWEKIRASSSIPGIIPPVVFNSELHLDGGLLNNLPIDVMRLFLGNKAKIIGVDLNTFIRDRYKYQFPPILTFKQTVLAKLGLTQQIFRFPRFVDTFLRSLFIGSLAKSRQNSLAANILVGLDLNKFRLLHSNKKQIDRLVQIGYESTLREIARVRADDE